MTVTVLYISTFVIFMALDYVGLTYLVKPTFVKEIGPMMRENFLLGPAFVFYALYIAGVLWFVSLPALAGDKSLFWVLGTAAILGGMAYGTYEFTNLATLKGWTGQMVATDLIWGMALTGTSAMLGVLVTRTLVS